MLTILVGNIECYDISNAKTPTLTHNMSQHVKRTLNKCQTLGKFCCM